MQVQTIAQRPPHPNSAAVIIPARGASSLPACRADGGPPVLVLVAVAAAADGWQLSVETKGERRKERPRVSAVQQPRLGLDLRFFWLSFFAHPVPCGVDDFSVRASVCLRIWLPSLPFPFQRRFLPSTPRNLPIVADAAD